MLPAVQHAVSRDRKLKIRYRKPETDGPAITERIVDPLGLVAKGSSWYLVANTPRGFRTYRVSRMEGATLLDKPCQRPANFDLAAHWKSATKQFLEDMSRYQATLHVELSAAKQIKQWVKTSSAEGTEKADKGWTILNARFEREDQACFVVLGFGSRVEVIKPESLRKRVDSELSVMLNRANRRIGSTAN